MELGAIWTQPSGHPTSRSVYNVRETAARLTEPWKPLVVAEANGFLLKVVRLHGAFPWHVHAHEDELFYCIEGSFRIEQEWAPEAVLQTGDVVTVMAGRRHRPVAEHPAVALIFERAETKQYGDRGRTPRGV
jgi:mannose-6-phosphate isomerase-like protein (cupin superfamily)